MFQDLIGWGLWVWTILGIMFVFPNRHYIRMINVLFDPTKSLTVWKMRQNILRWEHEMYIIEIHPSNFTNCILNISSAFIYQFDYPITGYVFSIKWGVVMMIFDQHHITNLELWWCNLCIRWVSISYS